MNMKYENGIDDIKIIKSFLRRAQMVSFMNTYKKSEVRFNYMRWYHLPTYFRLI